MSVLRIVLIWVEVLLLFNLLIFVHELGHFLAARWRGLKIDRFAIWFGKPIWKKKIHGVEYALGMIPAGGYVALPQMATMEVLEGKSESSGQPLPPVSALDRIIVAFAGPLFSFLLALAFALVVWAVGRPVSESEKTTTIGFVVKGGPADEAGLRAGDRLLSVDGRPVTKWSGLGDSVTWRIVRSEGATVPVQVEREGRALEFSPKPSKEKTKPWERKSLRKLQIAAAQPLIVGDVAPHSPAARAGLRTGDQLLSVDGLKLYHFAGLEDYVTNHPQETLALTGLRACQPFELRVKPEVPVSPAGCAASLGILTWEDHWALVHPSALEQVWSSVTMMAETCGAIFARHSDISPQHLGGAVKIMDAYYRLFKHEEGWRLALWFSVLMNVNLALLNLLPIPVLDGGHILLAVLEALRRRPISARVLNAVQTTCAVLLIGFVLYITFYDVQDLPWRRSKDKADKSLEIKFAPKAAQPG